MKRKLSVLLVTVVVLSSLSVAPVSANAPLTGAMDLQFNLGWPGPQDEIPIWVGTITIDGVEYGMAFFNIGSGKPFESDPSTSVIFFQEIWKIYDMDGFVFDFDTSGFLTEFVEGPVLLRGHDRGIVSLKNSKYQMNGSVAEAAEPFEEWVGSNVHMSGIIEFYPFGAPQFAPGTFRSN